MHWSYIYILTTYIQHLHHYHSANLTDTEMPGYALNNYWLIGVLGVVLWSIAAVFKCITSGLGGREKIQQDQTNSRYTF